MYRNNQYLKIEIHVNNNDFTQIALHNAILYVITKE